MISLKSIYKIYNVGGEEVRALDGVDLSINNNEYLSIMGPSGSGKSTMMNMIGCLDSPSSGLYEFEGEKVKIMDDYIQKHSSKFNNENLKFSSKLKKS